MEKGNEEADEGKERNCSAMEKVNEEWREKRKELLCWEKERKEEQPDKKET